MDSNSQFFEECNSSESGWTMYIGSPSSTGDGDVENIGDFDKLENNICNKEDRVNEDEDEGGDTDDSMASDASSGPISHFSRNVKSSGVAMVNFKNSKEKGKEKDCSFTNNKAKKMIKNEVKECIFAAKGTKSASNGINNKVRKSIWMGKGK